MAHDQNIYKLYGSHCSQAWVWLRGMYIWLDPNKSHKTHGPNTDYVLNLMPYRSVPAETSPCRGASSHWISGSAKRSSQPSIAASAVEAMMAAEKRKKAYLGIRYSQAIDLDRYTSVDYHNQGTIIVHELSCVYIYIYYKWYWLSFEMIHVMLPTNASNFGFPNGRLFRWMDATKWNLQCGYAILAKPIHSHVYNIYIYIYTYVYIYMYHI